jgi:hypothetical protein
MLTDARGGGLFVFFVDLDRFEVFRLENLATVEALDVIDTVASGNHLGTGVIAGGYHNTL